MNDFDARLARAEAVLREQAGYDRRLAWIVRRLVKMLGRAG